MEINDKVLQPYCDFLPKHFSKYNVSLMKCPRFLAQKVRAGQIVGSGAKKSKINRIEKLCMV